MDPRLNQRLALNLVVVTVTCLSLWTPPASLLAGVDDARRMAVTVREADPDTSLPGPLMSLLEAEVAAQWDGFLVERDALPTVLEELERALALGEQASGQPTTGRLLPADLLLEVEVKSDAVSAILRRFPSTDIVFDKTYHKRLEPASLAMRITTDALRRLREVERDPHRPTVAVGSIFHEDPHRRFDAFMSKLDHLLREALLQQDDLLPAERWRPSALLDEFDLARTGLVEQSAASLAAPPADLLLLGEFQPKAEHALDEPGILLEFTLTLISPTELHPVRKITFVGRSDEPEQVVEQVMVHLNAAGEHVRERLETGDKRRFSDQEYETHKRRAFEQLPNPPEFDGDYFLDNGRGSPHMLDGSLTELRRALRALESAMLFKGDDTQVLVATAAILNRVAERTARDDQPNARLAQATALDLIERAYLLDSNANTRGMYSWILT